MTKLNKTRTEITLNTYAELMKVCACGVCDIGCTCSNPTLDRQVYYTPLTPEARYRIDFGNYS